MQKKLTISINEDIYAGLYRLVGRRKISRFIESLVRPYVVSGDIREGYSADAEREAEAREWVAGTDGHGATHSKRHANRRIRLAEFRQRTRRLVDSLAGTPQTDCAELLREDRSR